ncbi:phospholipase [Sphaerisporangium album]|uniref:Phospholipase n=1 Tax=Sphaerisporangium album TaxID=509200 RepID=A0A367F493_9ACTN|nr:phospholipase [Sphaerisporangium album]
MAIPHDQLEQFSPPDVREELIAQVEAMDGVFTGPSQVSDPRSLAFRVREPRGPWEAFLTPTRDEFGHVHTSGFLHLMLPLQVITVLAEAGWVEMHPITRRPDFPDTAVMFYAPRDHDELAVALAAIRASLAHAAGTGFIRT